MFKYRIFWNFRLLALFLFSFLMLGMGCGGDSSACPDCLTLLLKVPPPSGKTPQIEQNVQEQLRLNLYLKEKKFWYVLENEAFLKNEEGLWLFNSPLNAQSNASIRVEKGPTLTTSHKKYAAIKSIYLIFSFSEAGKELFRNEGLSLRLLALPGEKIWTKKTQLDKQGKKKESLSPIPKTKLEFQIEGSWWVDGYCINSFSLKKAVTFAQQSTAHWQSGSWSGKTCH